MERVATVIGMTDVAPDIAMVQMAVVVLVSQFLELGPQVFLNVLTCCAGIRRNVLSAEGAPRFERFEHFR